MQGARRLICVICMILILIFAIIHLAVSISILAKFSRYGDVFRPEIGLAAFNIVISVYALLVGGFGLFSVLTDRGNLSTVVAFAAIVLVIFTLASLITALIINSLAITYVRSRFSNHMDQYKVNQDSRNIVNKIQTNYDCCGTNTWLDWARVSLNATGSGTTTRITPTSTTTTGTVNVTGTTTVINAVTSTTTVINAVTSTTTVTNEITTTITTENIIDTSTDMNNNEDTTKSLTTVTEQQLKLFNNDMKTTDKNLLSWEQMTNFLNFKQTLQQTVRRRRQAQSDYGGISGLPLSFDVTLPQSCCTNNPSTTGNLSNLYCISNANNGSNNFHTDGCGKELGKLAVGQTLGLAVINSFLVILALAAIPALIETDLYEFPPQNEFVNQSMQQYQPVQQYYQPYTYGGYGAPLDQYQQPYAYGGYDAPAYQYHQPYADGGYSAPAYDAGMLYSNYNPAYLTYH